MERIKIKMNGIYIKNMKAPEDCFDCAYGFYSYVDNSYRCKLIKKNISIKSNKPKDCPIISVTDGKWIESKDFFDWNVWECSNCHNDFVIEEGTPLKNEYHFCPYCGTHLIEEKFIEVDNEDI